MTFKTAGVGLSALIAGLLPFVLSCSGGSTEQPAPGSRQDIRLALIDQARWCMSAHNMQPWSIALDPLTPLAFTVSLATERLIPAADPYSRQTIMSAGGFLAMIEDSAAARGFTASTSLFPEGELPERDPGAKFRLPLAQVRLAAASAPVDPGYLDAVSSATVKAGLGRLELPEGKEASFLSLNTVPGLRLDFVRGEANVGTLAPILKEAFRLEMTYEPTLAEAYGVLRRNARQVSARPWGLSYGSSFPRKSLGAIEFFETLFPMKMQKWGLAGADNFDKEVDRTATFLVIRTRGNSRIDQVKAGMLFQRVWLKAIYEGYALVPASQPLEEYDAMAGLYRTVHETLARPGETIQMIALVGNSVSGFRPGFRISTEKLLRPPKDPAR